MCGRFYIKGLNPDAEEFFRRVYGIDLLLPDYELPEGHLLPWNDIPAVLNDAGGTIKLTSMFWNLIPASAKEFKPPRTWFNTRKDKLINSY